MAVIRIYGEAGCPQVTQAADFLNTHGAAVECVDRNVSAPPPNVLARAASLSPAFPADHAHNNGNGNGAVAEAAADTDNTLASGPIFVRGGRVVVSSDPAALTSLMY